ncbi:helix-turn-helix transcriptional regulator [Paenibacillus thalictri]|uniref:WYL domain-containing protein n=1 Tax=Paenibacillus thalictri TaxID=2527873 RepID=A0A4V2J4A2_9BACL|nr:WYL domain-containing protein [Paenibacillus thalictri]TBL78661.1 WYL domain-containing protein [Paenibacillus thalictri]
MRADRLVSIVLLLQAHGKLTAKQLAEKLEVSERTVLRDMDALSASGIPVFAERGPAGGWQLTEGFRTDLTGLKKEEAQSLLLLSPSHLLNDLGLQQVFEDARLKLGAALPPIYHNDLNRVRERIHVDGAGWFASRDPVPHLLTIQEAVWQELKLRILYQKQDGPTERIIEPLGLVAKGSIWYVVAGTGTDEEKRSYRVSRILSVQVLDERFSRPADFDLAEYWEQSTAQFHANLPRFPIRVRTTKAHLPRIKARRFVHIERVEHMDDNMLNVDLRCDTIDVACEMLLTCGPEVEALEPPELRLELARRSETLWRLYRKEEGQ